MRHLGILDLAVVSQCLKPLREALGHERVSADEPVVLIRGLQRVAMHGAVTMSSSGVSILSSQISRQYESIARVQKRYVVGSAYDALEDRCSRT